MRQTHEDPTGELFRLMSNITTRNPSPQTPKTAGRYMDWRQSPLTKGT